MGAYPQFFTPSKFAACQETKAAGLCLSEGFVEGFTKRKENGREMGRNRFWFFI